MTTSTRPTKTLRVTLFDALPKRLRDAMPQLSRWAGLDEYQAPAVTTCFKWRDGAAFSAVVGRGGKAATVILLKGRREVIIGEGGLFPVLSREGEAVPEWAKEVIAA